MSNVRRPGLLKLAAVNSWLRATAAVVQSVVPRQISDRLIESDPEQMYEDTLSYLIEAAEDAGHPRALAFWEEAFETGFLARYHSIRALHACRAKRTDSYRQHGVRGLSSSLAEELAIAAFSGHASRERILAAVRSKPIKRQEGWVYCFTDASSPRDPSQNHYLRCGSEFMQAIAIALGLHCRGILSSQGRGYLIELDVPLRSLVGDFRRDLWRMLVTEHFKSLAGGSKPKSPPEFCIATRDTIPPECIRRIIPVADGDLDYRLPDH